MIYSRRNRAYLFLCARMRGKRGRVRNVHVTLADIFGVCMKKKKRKKAAREQMKHDLTPRVKACADASVSILHSSL